MGKVYDDWERLVRATVRKQELWELFHEHSRTPSDSSCSTSTPPSASPNSLRSRLSPSNHHRHHASATTSAARVSPLINSTRFKSKVAADHETPNEDRRKNGVDKEKEMRRTKSRMRLDRWILTRWLSKTFHSTSP